jgi:hypothetical protein
VNFSNSSLTSIINRSSLAVASNNTAVCSNTAGYCVSQPGTTTKLDAMVERVMNQPIYRNFGTHEGIVMTHVVNKGSSVAAPRWYELRKIGTNWSVYQQSTYAPADNIHRFMSSVCYDAYGNIVKKGVGSSVNCSNLLRGVYYINFDNVNEKFIKN